MTTADGEPWSWQTDSVTTEPFAFSSPGAGSVFTIAAFGGYGRHIVTMREWVDLMSAIGGAMLTDGILIFNESLPPTVHDQLVWHRVVRRGDYGLELSQLLMDENVFGARLVKCDDNSVISYQPDRASSDIATISIEASITGRMPVMTDEVLGDGFMMNVEAAALTSMDAAELAAEERYSATYDRETRELWYDLD